MGSGLDFTDCDDDVSDSAPDDVMRFFRERGLLRDLADGRRALAVLARACPVKMVSRASEKSALLSCPRGLSGDTGVSTGGSSYTAPSPSHSMSRSGQSRSSGGPEHPGLAVVSASCRSIHSRPTGCSPGPVPATAEESALSTPATDAPTEVGDEPAGPSACSDVDDVTPFEAEFTAAVTGAGEDGEVNAFKKPLSSGMSSDINVASVSVG